MPEAFLWNPLVKNRKSKISKKKSIQPTKAQIALQENWEESFLFTLTFFSQIPTYYLPYTEQCSYDVYPEHQMMRVKKRFPPNMWMKTYTARDMTKQNLIPGQFFMIRSKSRNSQVDLRLSF